MKISVIFSFNFFPNHKLFLFNQFCMQLPVSSILTESSIIVARCLTSRGTCLHLSSYFTLFFVLYFEGFDNIYFLYVKRASHQRQLLFCNYQQRIYKTTSVLLTRTEKSASFSKSYKMFINSSEQFLLGIMCLPISYHSAVSAQSSFSTFIGSGNLFATIACNLSLY